MKILFTFHVSLHLLYGTWHTVSPEHVDAERGLLMIGGLALGHHCRHYGLLFLSSRQGRAPDLADLHISMLLIIKCQPSIGTDCGQGDEVKGLFYGSQKMSYDRTSSLLV